MNYLRHFGLREAPFGITPDTSFFFPCRATQEAFNTLVVAVANGEGFIKITGEVGTGKTLLCRKFLAMLESTWISAYVPNPSFEPRTLYLALAEELGILVSATLDQHQLVKAITRTLLDLARQKKRVVLCMDESQAMSLETLEALRLLTNLETEKRKLMQVVLFGQPELDCKLAAPSIRQLLQRITFQHHMQGLEESEVGAYVSHRLAVAGFTGRALLSARSLHALHRASGGIPRVVNVLMHKSMLLAYGEGRWTVERADIQAAACDTPAAAPLGRWWQLGFGRP